MNQSPELCKIESRIIQVSNGFKFTLEYTLMDSGELLVRLSERAFKTKEEAIIESEKEIQQLRSVFTETHNLQ